jgi:hypothetical protein
LIGSDGEDNQRSQLHDDADHPYGVAAQGLYSRIGTIAF